MPKPNECHQCGQPTKKISRRIGFFGLQETYSTHCRQCLPATAAAMGLDPALALRTHDQLASQVEAAERAYRLRRPPKTPSDSTHI